MTTLPLKTLKPKRFYFFLILFITPLLVIGVILISYLTVKAINFSYRGSLIHEHPTIINQLMDDPQMGFSPALNSHTIRQNYNYFTDHLGARVNNKEEQTASNIDMLTIGGSFSWGFGMSNEKTFTERIKVGQKLKVANLSMGSYGLTTSWLMLKKNIALRPKLIVYGFINDHMARAHIPCAPAVKCIATPFVAIDENNNLFIKPPFKKSIK
jgi:hypothetical protein